MLPQKIIQNQPTSNLWAWGLGTSGQLGEGFNLTRSSPVQVGVTRDWTTVATGSNFALGIKTDGTLWSWGLAATTDGVLGLNSTNPQVVPRQVGTLTNWVSVGAGLSNASAINSSGRLFSWGSNNYGGVGDNTNGAANTRSSPVQIGTLTNWLQTTWIRGNNPGSAIAIKTDGTLWVWGRNNYGIGDSSLVTKSSPAQIGTLTSWATLAAGTNQVLAVQTDGTLWTWGFNSNGQLGANTSGRVSSPIQVGALNTWAAISTGNSIHSAGIKSDGTLWSTGNNNNGAVGDNTAIGARSSMVQIGTLTNWSKVSVSATGYTSLAIKTDGTLWGWGLNLSGQLGINASTVRSSPTQVGTLTNWAQVSARGISHALAIKTDGSLWAWGLGTSGQLGDNTATTRSSPVQVGSLTNWATVATGSNHSLGIKTDGTLFAWGTASSGQVGDSAITQRNSPVQVGTLTNWASVAGGVSHSLAIKTNGTLWGWGTQSVGQLGDNTVAAKSSPVQIGTLTNWSAIATSAYTTMAIKTDNTLWMWGTNANGQVGDNSVTVRSSPVQVGTLTNWANTQAAISQGATSMAIKTDGTLWGWGTKAWGIFGDNQAGNQIEPVQVGTLTNWVKVGAGGTHSFGIKTDGTLWSWGYNTSGQLGQNIATSSTSSPAQIGTLTNWATVAGGGAHSGAVRADGTLWTWGVNTSGSLGDNTATARSSPVQVGTLTNWSGVVAGGTHTVALKTN